MSLAEDLFADGPDQLLFEQFGEPAFYLARGSEASPRPINVIVERAAPELIGGGPMGLRAKLVVQARNHATQGITGSELVKNQDRIRGLAEIAGGATQTLTIVQCLTSDAGVLRLALA